MPHRRTAVIVVCFCLAGRAAAASDAIPPVTEPAATPRAVEPRAVEPSAVEPSASFAVRDAPPWFQTMVQRIVRENMPDKFVQEKDWGRTVRRWDGIHVRRDGWRIDTKRRWKEVNHGTWRRYEITPINPDENLVLRIQHIHDAGDGNVGFELGLTSHLAAVGRLSQWVKGVQLYSLSVEAHAVVRLRVWCQTGLRLDPRKLPPDVIVEPTVIRAELELAQFEIDRVSKVDGDVAKQLGRSLRGVVSDRLRDQQGRLPARINRQIAKHEDKLRFSASDFLASRWQGLLANMDEIPAAADTADHPPSTDL